MITAIFNGIGWLSGEVDKRLHPDSTTLVMLMDGQQALWDAADVFFESDLMNAKRVDILGVLHAAGYLWKAAGLLCSDVKDQKAFGWSLPEIL